MSWKSIKRLGWTGTFAAMAALCATALPASASQNGSEQLNSLLTLSTPDKNDKGEFYATGYFNFTRIPNVKEYNFGVDGEYGITDQLAVGANIPISSIDVENGNSHTGFGDISVFAQLNLDSFLEIKQMDKTNITAQLAISFPTGSERDGLGLGHVDFGPSLLAYHDFGHYGAGDVGGYGDAGFDLSTQSAAHLGFAATYEQRRISALLEWLITSRGGNSNIFITPGIVYRGFENFELALGFPIAWRSDQWGVTLKATYYMGH